MIFQFLSKLFFTYLIIIWLFFSKQYIDIIQVEGHYQQRSYVQLPGWFRQCYLFDLSIHKWYIVSRYCYTRPRHTQPRRWISRLLVWSGQFVRKTLVCCSRSTGFRHTKQWQDQHLQHSLQPSFHRMVHQSEPIGHCHKRKFWQHSQQHIELILDSISSLELHARLSYRCESAKSELRKVWARSQELGKEKERWR